MAGGIFSMALDALMVLAITGLWVMWYQQTNQRKKVERMLQDASEELRAATELLDQVMTNFVTQEEPATKIVEQMNNQDEVQVKQQDYKQDQGNQDPALQTAQKKKKDVAAYSSKIMRLSREGLEADAISNELDIPIAQVRLMLLLQAPKQ